jgi:hypothetical protein
MSNGLITDVGDKERLQVLLAEYNTLRAELLTRTSNGFQVAAITAGFVAVLLQWPWGVRLWIGLGISIVFCACCFWIIVSATAKLEARLRALERVINERVGQELLVWEKEFGAAQRGPYALFVRLAKWIGQRLGIAVYPE